jgi:hypothetical protein
MDAASAAITQMGSSSSPAQIHRSYGAVYLYFDGNNTVKEPDPVIFATSLPGKNLLY